MPIGFSFKDYGNGAGQDISPTLRSLGTYGANGGSQMAVAFGMGGASHTIRAESSKVDKPDSSTYVATPWAVRRLTPEECEALQGFPRGFTNIPWRGKSTSPDGPRYKALGNSWAVNCADWVAERLNDVDKW